MVMHKVLTLDYENEHNYKLIGIHASLEDYRLAFYLNSNLCIRLKRSPQDLDFSTDKISFSLYNYECKETFSSWSLIANKHLFVANDSLPSNYLFKEEQQTSVLIQEKKQIDYFLKIDGDFSESEIELIISKVNGIKNIITSYNINPQTLKSKDFLIF
jgi:hypothetical protein